MILSFFLIPMLLWFGQFWRFFHMIAT